WCMAHQTETPTTAAPSHSAEEPMNAGRRHGGGGGAVIVDMAGAKPAGSVSRKYAVEMSAMRAVRSLSRQRCTSVRIDAGTFEGSASRFGGRASTDAKTSDKSSPRNGRVPVSIS